MHAAPGSLALDREQEMPQVVLLSFLTELGRAMVASGGSITSIEESLTGIALAYGAHNIGIAAFPTALFIKFDMAGETEITFSPSLQVGLRLDQIGAIFDLVREAEHAAIAPSDGLVRLTQIRRSLPRFNLWVRITGHMVMAIGLALMLVPSQLELAAAAILGAFVGGLRAFTRQRDVYAVPLSVFSSFLVGVIVFTAYRYGYGNASINLLIPALVSFLPGSMLTMAMVELAYGEMVAGSSRLMTGFVQLLLLFFGVFAAAELVGVSADKLVNSAPSIELAAWSPWVGVFVYGIGIVLHSSAPSRTFWWLMLVLYTAYIGQFIGNTLFGPPLSGFAGAIAMMPTVYLIQDRLHGPPLMVTFLPGFWLLVPGALGFRSVVQIASDNNLAGLDALFTTIFSITAIALGCLVGTTLYQILDNGLQRVGFGRETAP